MTRGSTISLLLLAAIVLTLAALLLIDDDDARAPTPHPAQPAPQPEATETAPVDPPIPYEEIATDTFDEEDEIGPAPASLRDVPRYVLVRGADGEPVGGATVRLVRRDQARDERRRAFDRSEPRAAYRIRRTDREGRAPLHPLPARAFRIEAMTDAMFGAIGFALPEKKPEDAPREVELQLLPSPRVLIRVLQEDGMPAEAMRVEVHPDPSVKHRWDDRIAVWTDASGEANARLTFENRWGRDGAPVLATVRLLDGSRVTTQPVTPEDGAYNLELTVPRMGTIGLTFALPNGEPYTGSASLKWWRIKAPVKNRRSGRSTAHRGFGVIGDAPPGERLVLRIRTKNRSDALCAIDVHPNGAPQDEVCTIGAQAARLTMTLTTAEGNPLPWHRFRAKISQDDDAERAARMTALDPAYRPGRTTTVRAQADSRATLTVRAGAAGQVLLYRDRNNSRRRGDDREEPPEATITFPALEEDGEHDAGAVPIRSFRLIVAGTVIGTDGEVVPSARIYVDRVTIPKRRSSRTQRSNIAKGWADDEGRFSIPGVPPSPGKLLVYARSRYGSGSAEPVTFNLGATDVRLVLNQHGAIRGRVTLNEPSLPLSVDIRLTREDGPRPTRVEIKRDKNGQVHADKLTPGVYGISVRVGGLRELDLHGIRVDEGETVVPPALADLVVGQAFRTGRVYVRYKNGSPASKVRINTRERTRPRSRDQSLNTDKQGEAVVVWRPGIPIDVSVRIPEWRGNYKNPTFPLVVTIGDEASGGGPTSTTVSPLIVTFDTPLPRAAPIASYRLRLTKMSETSKRPILERQTIRTGPDRAVYRDIAGGTYSVSLEVHLVPAKRNGRGRSGRADMGQLTILGTGGERAQIRVDFASIDHAVRNAR